MTALTVCLLNCHRPQSIAELVPVLANQSIKPKIFLWNNGEKFKGDEPFLRHITWLVESSENRKFWPRWMMAAHAETDFVCSWDDDLKPRDPDLFRDVLLVYHELQLTGAVGPFGVGFIKDEPYESCHHHKANKMMATMPKSKWKLVPKAPREARRQKIRFFRREASRTMVAPVDMIKGRHLLLPRRELLDHVSSWEKDNGEDDIKICGGVAGGLPGKHNVLAVYNNRFVDTDTPEDVDSAHAWSRRKGHSAKRQKARELFFPGL